ncbi:hypothetical protein F4604DRAFT_1933238 [Suillus subluteus]|nr:hypothetical protein F4604DRAFT_1933238 [Suillus subluteus]
MLVKGVFGDKANIHEIHRRMLLDMGLNQLAVICGYKDWKEWKERTATSISTPGDDSKVCREMVTEAKVMLQGEGESDTGSQDSNGPSEYWKDIGKRTLHFLIIHEDVGVRSRIAVHTTPDSKAMAEAIAGQTAVGATEHLFAIFDAYLAELNEILPVSRMVFDEAHLALLSDEFRVSMQDLHELRQFSMQLILLTGTMPQSSVAALKTMFGLLRTAIYIRESINRPELEYIMRQPAQSNTLETKVTQIVEQERKQFCSTFFLSSFSDRYCIS